MCWLFGISEPSTVSLWTNITQMFGEEVWLHKKESNFPHFPDFCPSVPRCLRSYNQEIPAVMKVLGRFHLTNGEALVVWRPCCAFLSKKWEKIPLTSVLRIYALMITSLVYICVDVWLSGKVQYISGYVVGKASRRNRSLGICFRSGSKYTPENQHDIGKSRFSIGNTSSNGGCSIVMLVFAGVDSGGVFTNLAKKQRKEKQLRPRSTPGRKNTENSLSWKCNVGNFGEVSRYTSGMHQYWGYFPKDTHFVSFNLFVIFHSSRMGYRIPTPPRCPVRSFSMDHKQVETPNISCTGLTSRHLLDILSSMF